MIKIVLCVVIELESRCRLCFVELRFVLIKDAMKFICCKISWYQVSLRFAQLKTSSASISCLQRFNTLFFTSKCHQNKFWSRRIDNCQNKMDLMQLATQMYIARSEPGGPNSIPGHDSHFLKFNHVSNFTWYFLLGLLVCTDLII